MSGVALVTINSNQWSVEIANTYPELATGLSGRRFLFVGEGMLFVLPSRQVVNIDTTKMLFPIDIVFIKNNNVLDIARSISPGQLVREITPCDMFLEVNTEEAKSVEVGDNINIEILYSALENNLDNVLSSIMPLVFLGFFSGMLGGLIYSMGESSSEIEHHSIYGEPRRKLVEKYGSWAVGRAEAVCPENDVACVTKEAKRLYETIQSRYGREVEYVTILTPGQTVFHSGDVVSIVALEIENKRVRELGENEATWQI